MRIPKGILLYAALTAAILHTSDAAEPLWEKAVAVARTNAHWVPGLTINRSEVIYKGDTAGVREIWTRSTAQPNGEILTETIKVLEDGKDITKKEAKANKPTTTTHAPGSPGTTPFNPKDQDRLSVQATDRIRAIAGHQCVAYAFKLPNTNATATGTAWLDKETGVPMEVQDMTFNPLPDKHLKSMSLTIRYESTPDGAWRAKEMITTGSASMLLIKTDIRNTVTFSNYWHQAPRRRAKTQ